MKPKNYVNVLHRLNVLIIIVVLGENEKCYYRVEKRVKTVEFFKRNFI